MKTPKPYSTSYLLFLCLIIPFCSSTLHVLDKDTILNSVRTFEPFVYSLANSTFAAKFSTTKGSVALILCPLSSIEFVKDEPVLEKRCARDSWENWGCLLDCSVLLRSTNASSVTAGIKCPVNVSSPTIYVAAFMPCSRENKTAFILASQVTGTIQLLDGEEQLDYGKRWLTNISIWCTLGSFIFFAASALSAPTPATTFLFPLFYSCVFLSTLCVAIMCLSIEAYGTLPHLDLLRGFENFTHSCVLMVPNVALIVVWNTRMSAIGGSLLLMLGILYQLSGPCTERIVIILTLAAIVPFIALVIWLLVRNYRQFYDRIFDPTHPNYRYGPRGKLMRILTAAFITALVILPTLIHFGVPLVLPEFSYKHYWLFYAIKYSLYLSLPAIWLWVQHQPPTEPSGEFEYVDLTSGSESDETNDIYSSVDIWDEEAEKKPGASNSFLLMGDPAYILRFLATLKHAKITNEFPDFPYLIFVLNTRAVSNLVVPDIVFALKQMVVLTAIEFTKQKIRIQISQSRYFLETSEKFHITRSSDPHYSLLKEANMSHWRMRDSARCLLILLGDNDQDEEEFVKTILTSLIFRYSHKYLITRTTASPIETNFGFIDEYFGWDDMEKPTRLRRVLTTIFGNLIDSKFPYSNEMKTLLEWFATPLVFVIVVSYPTLFVDQSNYHGLTVFTPLGAFAKVINCAVELFDS